MTLTEAFEKGIVSIHKRFDIKSCKYVYYMQWPYGDDECLNYPLTERQAIRLSWKLKEYRDLFEKEDKIQFTIQGITYKGKVGDLNNTYVFLKVDDSLHSMISFTKSKFISKYNDGIIYLLPLYPFQVKINGKPIC